MAGIAVVLLVGCGGDDGGGSGSADPELVELLQQEAAQTEGVATCIAERLDGNEAVDREQLESIIRGEGTTDVETADAYGDAALACAQELLGDIPGVPDGLTDQLDLSG